MNNQLFELRKTLKLSQEVLGESLGVTKAGISKIETGERNLTDTMIKLICGIYNVNEMWLRTGEGDMFNPDPDDELAWVVGQVFQGGDEFKKAFVTELLKMDEEGLDLVKGFINGIANKMK